MKFNANKGIPKLVRKIREFKKSGVKLQSLTEEGEQPFGSSYREVRKSDGLINQDSSVLRCR